MTDIEILLDSNIYFHFAIDFHPLLPGPYEANSQSYRLSVIDDLQREFERNSRLQNKFYWVKQDRYLENRSNNIVDLRDTTQEDIDTTTSYIKGLSIGSASPVDLRALAIAEILNIAIATDDRSMQDLADDIQVDVFTSLDMLDLFHLSEKADKEKLAQVVHFWIDNADIPYKGFIEDFEERFEIALD